MTVPYQYLAEDDVHALDCAGVLDAATGLERLHLLRRKLSEKPPRDGVAKLLVDFRRTVWRSPEDHMELSRATRGEFDLNAESRALRMAFLHDDRIGQAAANECWFSSREDALAWLRATGERTTPD